jgi:carbon-monoxide dehydrogenase medium subunit
MLNLRLAQPTQLIDVSRIETLRAFSLQGEVLRIGAAVTHAQIEDGVLPDVTRGLLPKVAGGIAYRAVRNRGTLGGSLAHADPAADWVSTMALLDATLVLQGPRGERRLRAGEFLQGPFTTALAEDELLVAIEVPRFSGQARWAYRKVCRKPGEFAQALAAVWVDASRGIARVVLGALDGMPAVLHGADALAALRTQAGVARALDAAGVTESYERQLHAAMLQRALADLDSFA